MGIRGTCNRQGAGCQAAIIRVQVANITATATSMSLFQMSLELSEALAINRNPLCGGVRYHLFPAHLLTN
jgi:hypothetical protein